MDRVEIIEGVEKVRPPAVVYHGTRPPLLFRILKEGLRSRSGMSNFGDTKTNPTQIGVSVTTNFKIVNNGNFGNLVLAIHTAGLSRLSFYKFQDPSVGPEDELRVVDEGKSETVIPFSHVFAIYRLTPELPRYEVKELLQAAPGLDLFTSWHGKITPVTLGERVAARYYGTVRLRR